MAAHGRIGAGADREEALRRRARAGLAADAARAPARAHFRAMGIDPARLRGPIVGVAWRLRADRDVHAPSLG